MLLCARTESSRSHSGATRGRIQLCHPARGWRAQCSSALSPAAAGQSCSGSGYEVTQSHVPGAYGCALLLLALEWGLDGLLARNCCL